MTLKWTNWARTERSSPVLSVAPRTLDQVVLAVQRALETGHTVKPIGASHSFTGIGATDGVRLDLSRLRGLVGVDLDRDRVTLWAGTHLWELPAILEPLGLALENMGDVDRQTISGATSTGTHGTGLRFGSLATRITGATLVTGRGEVLTVDETQHPELLPAVALGLGALGVLVTLTIQCVPRFLMRAVEEPIRLETLLEEFEARNREADHFEFFWFPHTEKARTKTNSRLPFAAGEEPRTVLSNFLDEEFANNAVFGALVGLERWMPASTPRVNRFIEAVSSRRDYTEDSHRVFVTPRRVRFREMEYALPLEAVPAAVRELREMIDRCRFRVSFPVEVRTSAADPLWLSTGYERECGHIAVHRYAGDPDLDYFREAETILRAHDGRPHWGKMHTLGADELRECYPAFGDFLAVRDRLDPDRVFANPYLQRVLGE
ncbi:MAG: D-arabinono-1,4-lactone oxidase [Leucobacter sp.]